MERGGLGLSRGKVSLPRCYRVSANHRRHDRLYEIPAKVSGYAVLKTASARAIRQQAAEVSGISLKSEGELI